MYNNIGKKIKMLAKVICWIGIIASVIFGLFMIAVGSQTYYGGGAIVVSGFIIMIVGSLFSWIGSFFTYGFGELIDKTCEIEKKMGNCGAKRADPTNVGSYFTVGAGETVDNSSEIEKKAENDGAKQAESVDNESKNAPMM